MLQIAIGIFVISGIFGLTVLTYILKNRPTPKPAVIAHGVLVITGFSMVVYFAYHQPDILLVFSVILFVLAALGGLTLFSLDMMNKPLPKMLALMHPVIAVAALATLIIYVLQ